MLEPKSHPVLTERSSQPTGRRAARQAELALGRVLLFANLKCKELKKSTELSAVHTGAAFFTLLQQGLHYGLLHPAAHCLPDNIAGCRKGVRQHLKQLPAGEQCITAAEWQQAGLQAAS